MKGILIITFCFCPILIFGQAGTDFLMYDRIVAYGYNEKHELISIDTSFSARGMLTMEKSTAYIRDLSIFNNRTEKMVKWNLEKVGNYVRLQRRDKAKVGVIVNDSTLNWKLCCKDTIDFFIVSIPKGIEFTPFNGQLILKGQDSNGKILLNEFDERGLQKTSTFYQLDSFAIVYDWTTRYTNSKYNYLTSLGATNQFIQLRTQASDTLVVANYYTIHGLKKGERIKGQIRLLKKPFPDSEKVREMRDYLLGTWHSLSGRIFDDSTNQWRRLNECNYNLDFSGDSLSITRKFLNNSYAVGTETTKWKVSSSGDFIVIQGRSSFSNPNIVLVRKREDLATFTFQDSWTTKRKRRKTVSIVLEAEKINRR